MYKISIVYKPHAQASLSLSTLGAEIHYAWM